MALAGRLVALLLSTWVASASMAAAQDTKVAARGLQPPGTPPQRIVSVVPSVTETLFAIGAGPRVIAVSSFDTYPPEVAHLPKVGALFDPDVERILSLRPDLVVVYGSQTDLIAQLGRANIPTYVYRHGSLADITAGIRDLGVRLGLAGEGRRVAATIDGAMGEIRTRLKGGTRPRTLLVIGREPQSLRSINASGGIGFLHDLLELAGGANVFADVKRESLLVSTETILAKAPEVIIELHYSEPPIPEAIARERKAWTALSAVPAVKAGRVYLLYGGELVVPGPRVVVTAQTFARALHPDIMPW
ncbi:MAG: helical backbone metal receptor [Acidobacteria bacterium]|nr:helical backbone metal receptor [Acidobacteriota bacterium]